MRLQRGIVLSLLVTSAALGACKSSTSASNPCAKFQGTWNAQSLVYTANADTTVTTNLVQLGAALSLTVDNNCNYTGTANIPLITSGTADIHGNFTVDSDTTLTLNEATTVGQVINNTYEYSISSTTLVLTNPNTTFDFDFTGPNPAVPATVTLTFVKG